MHDLDEGPYAGPRRLAAVPESRDTPFVTRPESRVTAGPGSTPGRPSPAAVVPGDRLLETASAMVDGAAALYAHLRHLEPDQRHAVLDLVADQMHELIRSWTALVRDMVPGHEARHPDEWGDAVHRAPHEASFPGPRPTRSVGANHPARAGATGEIHTARGAPSAAGRATVRSLPVDDETAPNAPPTAGGRREPGRHGRDELTGVLNRGAGLAALQREVDRCRRGGERFVLGYLNVDGMTAINDTRGLRAGDEVLRKVTAALRATLRSYDVITRLGGDEFLFSVPGADAATAELRVKEFSVILAEDAPGVSASVGFAELHLHATLDELVAEAETVMLKGRRQRRRGRG
jgi:diguanylate cyclase (GGDEF)-like protein